jgi:hypothetical protein
MSNYKSIRIDTRGFERVNGRVPTNQEIRQEVINAFEKKSSSLCTKWSKLAPLNLKTC